MPIDASPAADYGVIPEKGLPSLLWTTWRTIAESPILASSGHLFKFTEEDKAIMADAIIGLNADGGTEVWRPSNVVVDAESLSSYFDELCLLRSRRGRLLNQEYVAFKSAEHVTYKQLDDWKAKYANGFIPELS